MFVVVLFSSCRTNIANQEMDNNRISDNTNKRSEIIEEQDDLINPVEIFKEQNSELKIIESVVADLDNDFVAENILLSRDLNSSKLILWYIHNDGIGEVILEEDAVNYLPIEIVNRGNEKHISFMTYYEPSNTKLYVIRIDNMEPKIVFEFMADWDIRIITNGYQMVWKKYNEDIDVGGYELIEDNYYWSDTDLQYYKFGE